MVIDGSTAFVGSDNLTDNSLEYNRELGVVFDNATQVQKVATTIAGDFAEGSPL